MCSSQRVMTSGDERESSAKMSGRGWRIAADSVDLTVSQTDTHTLDQYELATCGGRNRTRDSLGRLDRIGVASASQSGQSDWLQHKSKLK